MCSDGKCTLPCTINTLLVVEVLLVSSGKLMQLSSISALLKTYLEVDKYGISLQDFLH